MNVAKLSPALHVLGAVTLLKNKCVIWKPGINPGVYISWPFCELTGSDLSSGCHHEPVFWGREKPFINTVLFLIEHSVGCLFVVLGRSSFD